MRKDAFQIMENEEIAKGLEKMLDTFLKERKDVVLKISSLSDKKKLSMRKLKI